MSIWTALSLLVALGITWVVYREMRHHNPEWANRIAFGAWEKVHGSWRG